MIDPFEFKDEPILNFEIRDQAGKVRAKLRATQTQADHVARAYPGGGAYRLPWAEQPLRTQLQTRCPETGGRK